MCVFEREGVCARLCLRDRESVCVCVCLTDRDREGLCMCACVCLRERDRERWTEIKFFRWIIFVTPKTFKRKRIVNQSPDFFAPARMPYGGSVTIASNISV